MANQAQENNKNTTDEQEAKKAAAKAMGKKTSDKIKNLMKSVGPYVLTAAVAGVSGFFIGASQVPEVEESIDPAE